MKEVIYPVFQPVLDLRTSKFGWLEALARIEGDDTQRGHIDLIQRAEKEGFIHEIDLAMVDELNRQYDPAELPISVNLSVLTIEQHTDSLLSMLEDNPGLASSLILEITETLPIRDVQTVEDFCLIAKALGCQIAVDDYGAGYFTAELVMRLAPNIIKLSQSLVNRVSETQDFSLLLEIYGVSSFTKARIVAEGIDTLDKLQLLSSMGCQYAQGYLIARPGRIQSFWNHHLYPAKILSQTKMAVTSTYHQSVRYQTQKIA